MPPYVGSYVQKFGTETLTCRPVLAVSILFLLLLLLLLLCCQVVHSSPAPSLRCNKVVQKQSGVLYFFILLKDVLGVCLLVFCVFLLFHAFLRCVSDFIVASLLVGVWRCARRLAFRRLSPRSLSVSGIYSRLHQPSLATITSCMTAGMGL